MSGKTTRSTIAQLSPTSLGGLVFVLISVVISALSYGWLGDSMRIRWTVGTHYTVGPDQVSTLILLVTFPVLLTAFYLGFRWLGTYLERIETSLDLVPVYELSVGIALGFLVLVQLGLVLANMYF